MAGRTTSAARRRACAVVAATAWAAVCAQAAQAWTSQLYPRTAAGGFEIAPVQAGGRTFRLLDYSYAGYRLGAAPPGTGLPCRTATLRPGADVTDALQAAVDHVGQAGGGSVRLGPGHYGLHRSIAVPYDNVAIVGAGSAQTSIDVAGDYRAVAEDEEGVFTFGKALGKWSQGWIDRGDLLAQVSTPIAEGDRHITLADAGHVQVGQWIVVAQYFWSDLAQRTSGGAWKSYRGVPDAQQADRQASFAYLRQVVAVHGRDVELDAPIPWHLDPANNPVLVRSADSPAWIRMHHDVGLAGVSIRFADNRNAKNGRALGAGVFFEGVRDAWAYDVQVDNFPRYGIHATHVARLSLVHDAVYRAQDFDAIGGWASGYGFDLDSAQNVLVRGSYAESTRHGFTERSSLTSMVVFTRDESAGTRGGFDDQHYGLAQGILWDHHRLAYGTGLQALYRGGMSLGAHETSASTVVWNAQSTGYRGGWYGNAIVLNPASDGWAAVVGGPGQAVVLDAGRTPMEAEPMAAAAGVQLAHAHESAGPGSRDQNVLYEGLYQPGLEPESLYDAQRAQRLGAAAADYSADCGVAISPGPFTTATYAGTDLLVYDGDHLGFLPELGGDCDHCDVNATAQNATPGGRFSLRVQVKPAQGASAVDFRGPERATSEFARLTMLVYPTTPSLRFRVQFEEDGFPEGNVAIRGQVSASAVQPNQWNRVELPLAGLPAGRFNTVHVLGDGADSAGVFYLDEMHLLPAR